MWDHFLAILWAQSRITRNHFARTTFGTVLSWTLSTLWYGGFLFLAIVGGIAVSQAPFDLLQMWFPAALLALFLYMQIVPLVTLSSGWSLQLNKLQIYPVSDASLFSIEVLLRLTSAPEMLIMLLGAMLGLFRRPDVFALAPFFLLLFIPFNLFLQLAIRDFLLHIFARNRFRELLMVLFIAIALLPQILVRSNSIEVLKPYMLQIAGFRLAPWQEVSSLSTGIFSFTDAAMLLVWIAIAAALAFWQFSLSKIQDDGFAVATPSRRDPARPSFALAGRLANFFADPMGAIVEKELRSMVRMPRFRVLFGMACIFSVVIFLPLKMGRSHGMSQDLVPVISLYGLLLLSDALLLNIFGFDRGAAQIYFVTPMPIDTAIKAKNCAALIFISLQTLAIPLVASLFVHITLMAALAGICASAVATLFLLSAGNLMSTTLPRPMDPGSTFRRQAGAKVQMWLLACSLGMAVLVGFAYLARWAASDQDWAFLGVLGVEFVIGLIVYRIALESSVARAVQGREAILAALAKNAAPIGAG
jgi:ABC-2 type transport system permease protein